MGNLMRGGMAGVFVRWASRLRFPYLFLLTAVLFMLNLFIPDVLPLADEVIMGLVAILFASLRKKPENHSVKVSKNDTYSSLQLRWNDKKPVNQYNQHFCRELHSFRH